MKKIYINIYSLVAIIIILAVIANFIHGIMTDAQKGGEEGKKTVTYFAKFAIDAAGMYNLPSDGYNEKLKEIAKELNIKAFVILDAEKQPVLLSEEYLDFFEQDELKNLKVKNHSFFTNFFSFELTLKPETGELFTITAAVQTLTAAQIFTRSRTAFFAAFTVFLITLIIILLQSLYSSEERVYAEVKHTDPYAGGYTETEKEYNLDSFKYPADDGSISNYREKNAHITYTLDDIDDLSITKKLDQDTDDNPAYYNQYGEAYRNEKTPEPLNEHEQVSLEEETSCPDNRSVRSFYSPISGACLMEYLGDVLQEELKRAASFEQDAALIIIKLKDFTLQSLVAKKLVDLFTNIIHLRNTIFEFEDDGFAVILKDTDINAAGNIAETFYTGIKNILNEYNISEPIAIGITSRASRIVDSKRMIEECKLAITKAIANTDNPIVAFRVNSEKYKQLIQKK